MIGILYFYLIIFLILSNEIKIELFSKVDSLKGKSLKEAYGVLLNYINSNQEINDWDNMNMGEQEAIKFGLTQLNNGEGQSHDNVIPSLNIK